MKSIYLLPIAALLIAGACSSNDPAAPAPLKEKTYTAKALQLFYNGQPMPSKTVSIAQDGGNAVVKVYSLFDLSEVGMGLKGEIPAAGPIPGSAELTIETPVTAVDGEWEFAGTGENDFCTYNYAGYATQDVMKLYLNDVELKSGGLKPHVWKPAPTEKDAKGVYTSLPFYIDWQYDPLPGEDIDFSPILDALTTLPLIPVYGNTAYMSLSEAVKEVLKSVAFNEDGNILVSYVTSVGGAYHLAQTYPNRYQYVLTPDNGMKVFVDPMSLFGLLLVNTSGGTPADKVILNDHGLFPADVAKSATPDSVAKSSEMDQLRTEVMGAAIKYLLPKMAEGLTFKYNLSASNLDVYIDTPEAVEMFNAILGPIIKDNAKVEMLMKYLAQNPATAKLLPEIQKLLPQFMAAFSRTNTLRIGFAFTPE